MARGIATKLRTLREAREAALRDSSGRDLVVAKAGVVDAELDKLGRRGLDTQQLWSLSSFGAGSEFGTVQRTRLLPGRPHRSHAGHVRPERPGVGGGRCA